jgi:hypothetical protein
VAQAISLALDIFCWQALIAGIVSLAIAWSASRYLPTSVRDGFAFPAAAALGFFAGYALLPRDSAPLLPSQSRDFLPYLALIAAVASASAAGRRPFIRWTIFLITIALAASLLTPTWAIFGLTRPASIVVLIVYLLLLSLTLETVPPRLTGRIYVALLSISTAALAVVVGAYLSIKFAQLAAIAAASLAGCFAAACLASQFAPQQSSRGIIPLFVVLVGGLAYVSSIEPDPPLLGFLVVPLIPLSIWLASVVRAVPFAPGKNG